MKMPANPNVSPYSLKRLSNQLTLIFSLLMLLSVSALTAFSIEKESERILENKKIEANVLAKNLAASSGDFLLTHDYTSIELSLLRLSQFPSVVGIQIGNAQGKIVADVIHKKDQNPEAKYDQTYLNIPQEKASKIIFEDKLMIAWQPIQLGELLGWIRVAYSLEDIDRISDQKWKESIYVNIIIICVTMIVLFLFTKRTTNRLLEYSEFVAELDINKGKQIELKKNTFELENLGTAINRASLKLKEQDDNFKNKLEELQLLASFPEMNPNIRLSINEKNEVRYINPYARRVLLELSLKKNDIISLLPENLDLIVSQCIKDNKTQTGYKVVFKNREFYWTFSPVKKQSIVHAYAEEIAPAN